MKKQSDECEDIKVNRRKSDKQVFESPLLQFISDNIDRVRDESKDVLKNIDGSVKDWDIDEFRDDAINHMADISDNLSQVKSDIMDSHDLPDFVKESSRNTKQALNMDVDYVRRAKRRLNRIDSDDFIDVQKTNIRVVELCDKAIYVNESNYEAFYIKGQALTNLEKYVEAIGEFVKALEIKEDYLDAWLGIANANRLNGDFDDSINVYDTIINNFGKSYEVFKGKAYVYFDCEDYKSANDEFEKANAIQYLDEKSMALWGECITNLK